MKLQDAAKKEEQRKQHTTAKVARILAALDKEDAKFLESLLRDGTRTHSALSRIMTDAGMPASPEAIKKWRSTNHVVTL